MFILSPIGYIFNAEFLRRECIGKFENVEGNCETFLIVMLSLYLKLLLLETLLLHIKYFFFSVVSYNGDTED